ncbi:MAG: ubiquitin-like small modifier protein 1 [Candidatus Margulisiibacteriota bacterium]
MVTIHIPTPLRGFVGGQDELVQDTKATVGDQLAALATAHPALQKHLFDDAGQLRKFINVYLNDEDVRYLQGPASSLKNGDVLSIVPSIAGGRQ